MTETPPLRSRLGHALGLLADGARLLWTVPSARERARLCALMARAYLQIASRQPGLAGRLVPTLATRTFELRPERIAPALRVRSDDLVLAEVYGGRPYDLDYGPLGPVRTILDLGANIGLASAFLAARLPQARVIAVEPNPRSFELLEENLRRLPVETVAVRAAVVAGAGRYRLLPGRSPSGDRLVARPAGASTSAADGDVVLPTATLPELLDRHAPDGVDLIKLDVEGAELGILRHAPEWAERVAAVVAEIHPPHDRDDCLRLLSAAGYEPLSLPGRRACEQLVLARRGDRQG